MRFFRLCFLYRWLYSGALFRIETAEKIICLTFDDGPDPGSTPELLQLLDKHNIKAVFFCNGKAAQEYPVLMELIRAGGHITGNHGYNHPDGWLTPVSKYMEDISLASRFTSGELFRPPYGRLRPGQYRRLIKSYKIIFWDIMSYDFDNKFGGGNSLKILKSKTRPGSVIVLHDRPDSSILRFLEEFIVFSISSGYRFVIPEFDV